MGDEENGRWGDDVNMGRKGEREKG